MQLAEDSDEFPGERIVGGHQRGGGLVAHFLCDETVHLAGARRAAQAVLLQTLVDGGRPGREPGGDVGHRPAEQPDEAELTQGAFAVRAKARRSSGDDVVFCHGRSIGPAQTPPEWRGGIAGGQAARFGRNLTRAPISGALR